MPPESPAKSLEIGDAALWFDAQTVANATINLGVLGGRWVVLAFLNELEQPGSSYALIDLLNLANLFDDDHVVFYGVVTKPPNEAAELARVSRPALGFIMDYSGAISRIYGALGSRRVIVLDPMLRIHANFPLEQGGASTAEISKLIRELPRVDEYAGVPLYAPALVVPNIMEPSFCQALVKLYDENGGRESGFMIDQGGKTATIVDHNLKSRRDFVIEDPEMRRQVRRRVENRLIPMIERFFHYRPTRMDRYMVSCYAAETGGHFSRHRDNMNAGARHRRFAVSINLNAGYDGCELIFPEFGRRLYRAPFGGAIAFSTGALHQVTPITRGKRYAFVPFLYGEEDAKKRLENNALLQAGEGLYTGENDRLFADKNS